MQYTYEQMFKKNMGVFTHDEQNKIRNLRVAVAGAGGLGGSLLYLLARVGVRNIRICDPEEFEVSNINRQFGCYIDTIGKNKAKAISEELLRINPSIELDVWDFGINNENANRFVDGCDIVIDAIEFYAIEASIALQWSAREKNIWVMTAQCAGSMASYLYMPPNGPNFSDLFFESGNLSMDKIVDVLFPVLPKEATPKLLRLLSSGGKVDIPGWSFSMIGTYILFDDLIRIFIKNEKDFIVAPGITLFDMDKREFLVKNV